MIPTVCAKCIKADIQSLMVLISSGADIGGLEPKAEASNFRSMRAQQKKNCGDCEYFGVATRRENQPLI